MKKFCANLKEHATEIINCEKKGNATADKDSENIQETKILSTMQRRIQSRI